MTPWLTPARTDPFADVISLVAGPIAAVIRSFDQLRRGADELMRGLENFNATMANLNETAERVNRLLNDFEEPIRAMLPQLTRTVKLADELSTRLSTPIDQVVPGPRPARRRRSNSPVLRALPTDLGQFMEVINDLSGGCRRWPRSPSRPAACSAAAHPRPRPRRVAGPRPGRRRPRPPPGEQPGAGAGRPRRRRPRSGAGEEAAPAKKAPGQEAAAKKRRAPSAPR